MRARPWTESTIKASALFVVALALMLVAAALSYRSSVEVQAATAAVAGAFRLLREAQDVLILVTDAETIGSLAGGSPGYGTVSLSANLTTGANNSTTQFDGLIAGAGGLIKSGTGKFTLTAANTYTGGTSVTGGTLSISNDNQLGGAAGGVTLNGGALRL